MNDKYQHFYHVTTWKKLQRYIKSNKIYPPLRCWKEFDKAEDFSKRTGRKIILRLLLNDEEYKPLSGHKNNAIYTDLEIPISRFEL